MPQQKLFIKKKRKRRTNGNPRNDDKTNETRRFPIYLLVCDNNKKMNINKRGNLIIKMNNFM